MAKPAYQRRPGQQAGAEVERHLVGGVGAYFLGVEADAIDGVDLVGKHQFAPVEVALPAQTPCPISGQKRRRH